MARRQMPKMLWYYSRIIDWMIANPGHPLKECAEMIGRTPTTLSMIINSDMFKAALAERKAEFQMSHDMGIIERTTKIATASLDAILTTIEKKRDAIPLETLSAVSNTALERLGYGIKSAPPAGTTINAQNATVFLPASPQDLQEARMALRQVQESKLRQLTAPQTVDASFDVIDDGVHRTEAGPVASDEEEERAPSPLPT